jgi:hypothetical protein
LLANRHKQPTGYARGKTHPFEFIVIIRISNKEHRISIGMLEPKVCLIQSALFCLGKPKNDSRTERRDIPSSFLVRCSLFGVHCPRPYITGRGTVHFIAPLPACPHVEHIRNLNSSSS